MNTILPHESKQWQSIILVVSDCAKFWSY